MQTGIPVYLEVGAKRTFAGAIDWPGWSRSGRDARAALQALVDYGPRYRLAVHPAARGFKAPASVTDLRVIERLKGSTTTDFGAPAAVPAADARKVNAAELKRLLKLLEACWGALDEAVSTARGTALGTGPRGGGRDLEKIVDHVIGAEGAYLGRLGWSFKDPAGQDVFTATGALRQAVLEGLSASAAGKIPAKGPPGGARWTPRYYVRRAAWHVLDHAWEIEDRLP
jgi:hypothetical protein